MVSILQPQNKELSDSLLCELFNNVVFILLTSTVCVIIILAANSFFSVSVVHCHCLITASTVKICRKN